MLEEEYYEIKSQLDTLEFRVPQSGVKFKYGNFLVSSDISKENIYFIKRDTENYTYNFLSIAPKTDSNVGFIIKEISMNYKSIMEFIHEIQTKKNKIPKISVSKTFYNQLLRDSRQTCMICLDDYSDENREIYINYCGHHSHLKCMETYGINKNCPVCRK